MISQKLTCPAPAKINLALHVTGQIEKEPLRGYHLIESLVVFADFGDVISVSKSSETPGGNIELTLTGPFAGDLTQSTQPDELQSNLVLKAASLFRRELDVMDCGIEICLEKNLPVSSGIGGGSADAAATYLALHRFFDTKPDQAMIEATAAIGADVPMCVHSSQLIAKGRGEQIIPLEGFPSLHLLLVNPGIDVSTPKIFRALKSKNNAPLPPLPVDLSQLSLTEWLIGQRNDLQTAAINQAPSIVDVLNALENSNAMIARMSGSGATCFGIYKTAEDANGAAQEIKKINSNWWVKSAQTKQFGIDRVAIIS